jgi:hypothetical protein
MLPSVCIKNGLCPFGDDLASSIQVCIIILAIDRGYTCRKGRKPKDPAACNSAMTSDSSFTISQYISTNSTTISTTTTKFYEASNLIFASGIVVRRSSNDPAWPASATSPSSEMLISIATISSTSNSIIPTQTGANKATGADSNLTTGSRIGIGLGVAFGVLILFGISVQYTW